MNRLIEIGIDGFKYLGGFCVFLSDFFNAVGDDDFFSPFIDAFLNIDHFNLLGNVEISNISDLVSGLIVVIDVLLLSCLGWDNRNVLLHRAKILESQSFNMSCCGCHRLYRGNYGSYLSMLFGCSLYDCSWNSLDFNCGKQYSLLRLTCRNLLDIKHCNFLGSSVVCSNSLDWNLTSSLQDKYCLDNIAIGTSLR